MVPIFLTLPADLVTPVIAYLRVSQGATNSFLLESITGGENVSRYSFLGASAWSLARVYDMTSREHLTQLLTWPLSFCRPDQDASFGTRLRGAGRPARAARAGARGLQVHQGPGDPDLHRCAIVSVDADQGLLPT